MLTRRNSSDSAIGWISTVDSLLLGFGLMLVLALHSAMTRQRVQVDADRTAAQLTEEKKAVEDLQGKDKARQEAIEALKKERQESAETIESQGHKLNALLDDRNQRVEESQRLREQVEANVRGVEGINEKLAEALSERDSLQKQLDAIKQQLDGARNELEDATRNLMDALAEVTREKKERDSLESEIVEMRAQLLTLKDRQQASVIQSDELNQEASRLKKAIDSKSVQIETMRQSLVNKDRELGKLKADQSEAADLLTRAKEDASKSKAQLDEANRKLAALEMDRAATEKQQKVFKTAQDQLQAKVAEVQAATARGKQLQGQLDLKTKEVEQLQGRLQDAEAGRVAAENTLQREASAKGQAAATDVLGFNGKFENVVFIIDISHSMTHVGDPERKGYVNAKFRPERWNKTKQEIVTWARNLRMKTLRLVLFHTRVYAKPGKGRFYPMDAASREASVASVAAALEKVTPDWATNTLAAFEEAYKYPGIDTMILFTDGRPMVKGRKTEDVIEDVQILIDQHPGVPVNVVGIGEYFEKSFADFLRGIADSTGGEFIGR